MKIDRRTYASHYGPTTGDRIRLGDTDLIIRVEHDATVYGDEAIFGGGKVIRDGMGQSATASRAAGSPDLVITNVVIVDSSGIRKADVGIRDGRISGIGKAGNPGVMDGVSPELVIGASTEVLAGEGLILTAGGKRDLILNDALPRIDVNPETYEVRADGQLLTSEPAAVLPLAQRYFLF